jgi:hypothetical protein
VKWPARRARRGRKEGLVERKMARTKTMSDARRMGFLKTGGRLPGGVD